MVETPAAQPLGETLECRHRVVLIVRVLVALAVALVLHQPRRGVTQRQGHGIGRALGDRPSDAAPRLVQRVRFWRQGAVQGGLGQGQLALGDPDEVHRVLGRQRDGQRAWVGHPDILAGKADDAA